MPRAKSWQVRILPTYNALILKAAFPDANITVDATCCAGVTPESHTAALMTMQMCQIDVI